ANSYNIPAVKTLDRIGVDTLKALAGQAGISTFTGDFGLALTLGGGEVKLLDLTAAYGIFRNGRRLDTQAILTVQDTRALPGEKSSVGILEPNKPQPASRPQLITPETAYLITDILADNVARIPAFGEQSVVELPFPAAVKTGTTTDWRDNWTIGYSAERIVGVWVGNADNTPMLDVSGIDGAGPIWRDLMLAAHHQPPLAFPRPEGIREIAICAPSGLLPSPNCTRTRLERFITGTEPTQVDNQFQVLRIDRATGLRATEATPAERITEQVYWLLPAAYHDWMLSQGIALAPPTPATVGTNQQSALATRMEGSATAPLVLTAPTSNTAYAIHPGMPQNSQRIAVSGYVANGERWAELRLRKDGEILAQGEDLMRLQQWWVLEPGSHQF
ncbi:MAG: hypothetical protein KDE31_23270, partial [Caldilineaceae bacterium]|nr:hypothetical protein [Caldilineaceae bacterium]